MTKIFSVLAGFLLLLSSAMAAASTYIYGSYESIDAAHAACLDFYYDKGLNEIYGEFIPSVLGSSPCGTSYEDNNTDEAVAALGTAFYRVTGGHWCATMPVGNVCYGGSYFFHAITPAFYAAVSPQPVRECEANPCDPISGRKFQSEPDYAAAVGQLRFTRYYSSWPSLDGNDDLTVNWRHNYSAIMEFAAESSALNYPLLRSQNYQSEESACVSGWFQIRGQAFLGAYSDAGRIFHKGACWVFIGVNQVPATIAIRKSIQAQATASTESVRLISEDGTVYEFREIDSAWSEVNLEKVSLSQTGNEYIFTDSNNVQSKFIDGILVEKTFVGGEVISFAYDGSGKLSLAQSNLGRQLSFAYVDGRLDAVTTPSGVIHYSYTGENLDSVSYPDASTRQYHYENPGLPSHLTGITNENGDRYATWGYDTAGRVILSEHAGGADRTDITYDPATRSSQVVGANGDTRTYAVQATRGGARVGSLSGDKCQDCPRSQYKARAYSDSGYLISGTDWNDVTTTYVRDTSRGLELSRTEAAGTADERSILTEWHPDYRLPTRITYPDRIVDFVYDSSGNLLSHTETSNTP